MNFTSNNISLVITKTLPLIVLTLGLNSCGSSGNSVKVPKTDGFQQSHGPFDQDGNYVEKWADSPPKRRFTSKKPGRSISTVKPKTTTKVKAPEPSPTPTKKAYTPAKQTYTPPKTTYSPPKKEYTAPKKTYTPTKKVVKATPKVTPKKPKPKKITPKAKAPIIHKVVKGDTLYGLSRKYNTSVAAIKTANGLSSNSISLGRNLIIPRK